MARSGRLKPSLSPKELLEFVVSLDDQRYRRGESASHLGSNFRLVLGGTPCGGAGQVAMSRSQFASPHHQQQGGYHPQAGGNVQPEQSPFGGALFARSTATPMPPAEHSGGQVCCCLSSLTSDAESRLCDRQHFMQPFLCHHLVLLLVGHTLHIEPHSPSRPLPLREAAQS